MIVRGESTIIDYHAPFDQGFNITDKYDSEVMVKNVPLYSTKIYLNRKRLSFFILNDENILSSVWKTTFYPRDKNHGELTERRMKMTKQLLVQAQRFMRN